MVLSFMWMPINNIGWAWTWWGWIPSLARPAYWRMPIGTYDHPLTGRFLILNSERDYVVLFEGSRNTRKGNLNWISILKHFRYPRTQTTNNQQR